MQIQTQQMTVPELPEDIRARMAPMGYACNEVAFMFAAAEDLDRRAGQFDTFDQMNGALPFVTTAVHDVAAATGRFRFMLARVFGEQALIFASFAARVAAALIKGDTLPSAEEMLLPPRAAEGAPAILLTLPQHVPLVQLPTRAGSVPPETAERNRWLAEDHHALVVAANRFRETHPAALIEDWTKDPAPSGGRDLDLVTALAETAYRYGGGCVKAITTLGSED